MCQRGCRYFQELVDTAIEIAKTRGTFTKGVQFVDDGAELVKRVTIWRSPRVNGGEVRFPPPRTPCPSTVLWACTHLICDMRLCTACQQSANAAARASMVSRLFAAHIVVERST
jgi:hypothetical protein